MSVLPLNYREPDTSNYMKLKQGENRFRVLSKAIVGMEYWKTEDKNRVPVRKKTGEAINISDLEVGKDGELEMPKHFWAFVVYNYGAEKVQILEITQSTIRRKLLALEQSKSWGDLREFDISITREGEGFDTVYETMPEPKVEMDKGIIKVYKDMKINLEALFDGDDPFKAKDEVDPDEIPDDLGK